MDTLGVWAGTDRDPLIARRHAGRASDGTAPGHDAVLDPCGLDPRPLGLRRAASLHASQSRQFRLLSWLVLLTPTRRVEREHALATVVVRDGLSLVVWVAVWVSMVAALPVSVLAALEVSPLLWPLVPLALAAMTVASSAVGQRTDVWWRWPKQRGVLAISNVAADPEGHGFGGALMGDLTRFADAAGRTMVLRVDADNERAVRLYRGHGFQPIEAGSTSRIQMMRRPTTEPVSLTLANAPSWLAPIPVTAPAVAVGAATGAALTYLYWATPASWLMLPIAPIASIAADCDLRWLRIPNRLLAVGAVINIALILLVALRYDVSILVPALAGAALAGGPLLVQHVATGGRSPGLGDVKLAGVLGLVAGAVHPAAAILGLLISLLLGAAFGLVWRFGARRGPGFPLGPSLAAGMAIVLATWPLMEGPTTW